MEPLNLTKCSASGKTRYPDPGAAKQAIQKLKAKKHSYDSIARKKTKHRQGKIEQCRYYHCGFCKGFHLTKIPTQVTIKAVENYHKEQSKNNKGLVLTPEEATSWKEDSLPFPETL